MVTSYTAERDPSKKETPRTAGTLRLIGGAPCLDFINTAEGRGSPQYHDFLGNYADLVTWAVHAEAISPEISGALLALNAGGGNEGESIVRSAIDVREALFRIITAASEGRQPDAADLAVLNHRLATAMSHAVVIEADGRFAWNWSDLALDRPLWPVVRSAANLLTSPSLSLVRSCPADDCGWLYVDTSRNHSRRWCSMETCGNRAKARRHYHRLRPG